MIEHVSVRGGGDEILDEPMERQYIWNMELVS